VKKKGKTPGRKGVNQETKSGLIRPNRAKEEGGGGGKKIHLNSRDG